jgi:putative addiction module killer protein
LPKKKRLYRQVEYFSGQGGKEPFWQWVESTRAPKSDRAKIKVRIRRIIERNDFGDHKQLRAAEGVSELRFDFGPDYRVYYAEDENDIVVILSGGDKTTQSQDIQDAIGYWKYVKENS